MLGEVPKTTLSLLGEKVTICFWDKAHTDQSVSDNKVSHQKAASVEIEL